LIFAEVADTIHLQQKLPKKSDKDSKRGQGKTYPDRFSAAIAVF
jgi:hypothetical protein